MNKDIMKTKIIGIGGMGINFVNYMIKEKIKKVEYITIDTNFKNSESSLANQKIFLDTKIINCTREQAERIAFQCYDQFYNLLKGTKILFLISGVGGATGSGITPVILEVAKKLQIFTITIVARPFFLEGFDVMKTANNGMKKIDSLTDSLIIIPNEKLYNYVDKKEPLNSAYWQANMLIKEGIESIVSILTEVGLMNIDLLDVRAVLDGSRDTIIRVGEGFGETAVKSILSQIEKKNLFEGQIQDAKRVLISFITGNEAPLSDIQEIIQGVTDIIKDKNIKLIWGIIINPSYEFNKKIKTVIISSEQ
ncbi:cell division protein FtsZ [Leptotrichia sp. oral taxon 847]|uniref:cell division protein FtsZ n=1 Tax=Leptotrichia sp. oral taxon 847 TaxID=1785996 RepID=UPI00076807AE|nr:cell division protein FtsZ [Leptotrichia sp. oral taxon 847]AMD94171.1 cell division protein MraZ [Leptotrichia sp. oral taxon 847]